MQPHFYIGLDVHKKTIVANVKDPLGKVLHRATLGSSDAELVAYLQRFDGHRHVALEACNVWPHVYDAAATVAHEVALAHPRKTRLIAEASLKSDAVDADALSELLRLNGLPKAYAPDPKTRDLRQLVRDRQFYRQEETAIKNHVYAVLLRRGLPYEDGLLGRKRAREELRRHAIPEVDRGLSALQRLEESCKELDRTLHQAFLESKEAQLLESIPGVGEYTALALAAELCPVARFPDAEHLTSYCGLVPTNHQTADTAWHGHMKKDASHFLMELLVEAGWAHRHWAHRSSDVVKIGNRVARRGGKGKGAGAAARKLATIVYAVLKRGTPYTPERPSREQCAAASPKGEGRVGMNAGRRPGPERR